MKYMFETGFLGTRAPFFMDFVTLIVAFLPLLIFVAISLAKRESYKAHAITQSIIFVISIVVFSYFEYGVRLGGGFDSFMEGSKVSHNYALWVLIAHIIISVITLVIWFMTLLSARKDTHKQILPGSNSQAHKKAGLQTFVGISLTAFTGVWVYLLLFVY